MQAAPVQQSRAQLSLYRTIFPQMSLWLPDRAEAADWRAALDAEIARLEAADAA